MTVEPILSEASILREEFDLAFAREAAPGAGAGERLLAVALGGDPYALRLGELAFLERGAAPAFVEAGVPGFMGLVGLRGELLPVWDLAGLLGYPRRAGRADWMACSAETPRWAAAFERFDGMLRASAGDLDPGAGEGPAARFVRGICKASGVCRPILDLQLISKAIREGSKR